jgi:hypothetical protein
MSDTEEKALIGRLEALEAPCRKVDMLIETLQTGNRQHPYLVGINIDDKPDAGRTTYPTPRYTASIDAAMTVAGKTDAEAISVLMEAIEKLECEGWPKGDWLKHLPRFICWAALCIAALRAQDALGFEIREKEQ